MIPGRILTQDTPKLVPCPLHLLGQRPTLTCRQTAIDLSLAGRTDNDPVVGTQRRMMHEPLHRGIEQRNPLVITASLHFGQRAQNLRREVDVAKDLHLVESGPRRGARDVAQGLRQQAARERRKGVEGHVQLPQQREQRLLGAAADRVIASLVDGGQDVSFPRADVVDALHLGVGEVGDAESREPALSIQHVDRAALLRQSDRPVRSVQVVDVDLVLPERLERLLAVLEDVGLGERPGSERGRFRRHREPCVGGHLAQEFLGPSPVVDACGVEFFHAVFVHDVEKGRDLRRGRHGRCPLGHRAAHHPHDDLDHLASCFCSCHGRAYFDLRLLSGTAKSME